MLGFWQSKAWSLILKYHSRQEGTKPQLLRYFVKLSLTLHHLLRRSLHSHQLHVYQLPSWGMCASLCQLWFTSYSVATVWYCCHNLSCWTAPSPPHDQIIFMCHPQITLLWRWGWSNNLWCATIFLKFKANFWTSEQQFWKSACGDGACNTSRLPWAAEENDFSLNTIAHNVIQIYISAESCWYWHILKGTNVSTRAQKGHQLLAKVIVNDNLWVGGKILTFSSHLPVDKKVNFAPCCR